MNTNSHESSKRGCGRSAGRGTEPMPRAPAVASAAAGTSSTAALRVTRRDFARYGAFAAISAITARLVVQRSREKCVNQGICRGCTEFADCGLPQALSARAVLKGGAS